MINEPKSGTNAYTEARLLEIRTVIHRSKEKMLLDKERLARSRQIVSDSEKRLKALREPVATGDDEDEGTTSL